jgi:hypothetical protein
LSEEKSFYDCWWTINGWELLLALQRVQNGQEPEMVYMELYANSTADQVQEED